jgi:hypothetical protein
VWLDGSWHCSSNHNVGAGPNSVGTNTLADGGGGLSFTLLVGEVVGLARPPLTGIRRHTFEAPGSPRVAGDLKARLFGGEVPFLMGAGDQAQIPQHDEVATPWTGKQERRTPAYTTCWSEMPVVRM